MAMESMSQALLHHPGSTYASTLVDLNLPLALHSIYKTYISGHFRIFARTQTEKSGNEKALNLKLGHSACADKSLKGVRGSIEGSLSLPRFPSFHLLSTSKLTSSFEVLTMREPMPLPRVRYFK
jgi:hypothetical protein